MANVLKHRFVSAKANGADATQVQPSHWNDGHAFTGGVAGDVLTRDPTDATFGAAWVAPGDQLLASASGAHTLATPGNITSVALPALGGRDTIAVHVDIQAAGATTPAPTLDLFGFNTTLGTGGVILTLTGATGAGTLTTIGTFWSMLRMWPASGSHIHAIGIGSVLATQDTQVRGAPPYSNARLIDSWTAGFSLYLRNMTGVPAGATHYWQWNVWRRKG